MKGEVFTWEDTPKRGETGGGWMGRLEVGGPVQSIKGPYLPEQQARDALRVAP